MSDEVTQLEFVSCFSTITATVASIATTTTTTTTIALLAFNLGFDLALPPPPQMINSTFDLTPRLALATPHSGSFVSSGTMFEEDDGGFGFNDKMSMGFIELDCMWVY
ncbi:Uncharacterized protein TCM_040186 [Theobroma cacao]|uniref:Uncharacterized protein n=1 Tax=Theobroma cacao TaxID=3641 RepID=A0A061GYT6_THECC|nr:Uncharacterized protein TCM_040186 [Theobroma cacao]